MGFRRAWGVAIRSKAGGPEIEAREGEHAHACGRVTDMAKTEEILCKQGCGKTFTTEGWRVKHELRCDGKPIATSGRIAANGGVPVSAPQVRSKNRTSKRAGSPARAHRTRRSSSKGNGHIDRITLVAPVVTPAAMLSALRAEAVKIQTAITAIEALG
jgi:uncharacterized Zn-binding protein involved in type VI secretion